jgi:hypothetical protein
MQKMKNSSATCPKCLIYSEMMAEDSRLATFPGFAGSESMEEGGAAVLRRA